MIPSFSLSLRPSWGHRRTELRPALQVNGVQTQGHRRADQGEGQCAAVLQIIERVCASHQEHLGFYPFLAWGDLQRHC
jgi:hypothetical protein